MRAIILVIILLLGGCGGVDIQQYRNQQPHFELYDFFAGQTRGWGIIQDRSGAVTRRFVVDINGTIGAEGRLTLDERFQFNDGEKSQRIWTISRSADSSFHGTASDVVGVARGEGLGNALHWQYKLQITVNDSNWVVDMDDWMYLQPDSILINRTKMSKFGVHLADITIMFSKTAGGDKP